MKHTHCAYCGTRLMEGRGPRAKYCDQNCGKKDKYGKAAR